MDSAWESQGRHDSGGDVWAVLCLIDVAKGALQTETTCRSNESVLNSCRVQNCLQ